MSLYRLAQRLFEEHVFQSIDLSKCLRVQRDMYVARA